MAAKPITIAIPGREPVSGLWLMPQQARALLVLAHGAGAGMTHKSMAAIADGLAARGIATLRFQFPYMEKGSKRPDLPRVAHAAVRAAVADACKRAPRLTLFAGGKSFGGRMTSQAQAESPLENVRGLIYFGFPLHPAGAPSTRRADHLAAIHVPMLFLQGTRDALAEPELLKPVVKKLNQRSSSKAAVHQNDSATLKLFADADHSFHVPKASGKTDTQILSDVIDTAAQWMVAI